MQSPSDHRLAAACPWSVVHPATTQDQMIMRQMRAMIEPNKGKMRGIAARVPFDAIMGQVAAPEGVTFRSDVVGGIAGWWCESAGAPTDHVILHAHGGWFNWGSAEAYRVLVGHIVRSAGVNAFVPDYRLAPEARFPAAIDDLQACYEGLLARGKTSVALTGDSAGGNLALVMAARLAAHPANRKPAAVLAVSPVTDLSMSGQSWETRAEAEPYFLREQVADLIASYLDGHDARDPDASPLYGALANLAPISVHVGDDEVLLDDSLRYVERAVAAGVAATVDVWEGMPHGFIGGVGRMEAATKALRAIGAFLSAQFDLAREATKQAV